MRRVHVSLVGLLAATIACQTTATTPTAERPEVFPDRPEREADAGRVTLKRLTNLEYDNTVASLLMTDLRPATAFPPDELAHGWDHMADAQTLSPLHLELYLQAAADLVETELASPVLPDQTWTFEAETDMEGTTGAAYGDFYNLWSNGSLTATQTVPHTGTYRLTASLGATQGGPDLARAALLIDGATAREVDVTGDRVYNEYTVEVELEAGTHFIGVAFLNDYYDPGVSDRNLLVDYVDLVGPIGVDGEPTPARERYYTCEETTDACAHQILDGFAEAAWRRPLDTEGRSWLHGLHARALEDGASWEEAVHAGAMGVLVSPRFLFRLELDSDPTSTESRPLDGYELASRLSYFLWRAAPDDTLLGLAADGTLGEDLVLREQVRRMMEDPRARTVVTEYAGQWLAIRAIDDVEPDYALFPEFDDALREAMRGEMEAFTADILLEDRSMLDLLTAEETYVNRRLADHYGVAPPRGDAFVKTTIEDYPRVGLFGKAGLLTALSYPKRTSPVKRGQWVMASLLCEEPPPAPAAVEGLDEEGTEGLTLRERMAKHREDPACATCHRVMDPIGFSMENYDATGAWRLADTDGHPIEAQGTWPGGPTFDNAAQLATALREDPRVAQCMAQTTFAYALGRPANIHDRTYLDEIRADFVASDHRFLALAEAIVLSEPFRTRRGESEEGQ